MCNDFVMSMTLIINNKHKKNLIKVKEQLEYQRIEFRVDYNILSKNHVLTIKPEDCTEVLNIIISKTQQTNQKEFQYV